jgi:FecR protein
MSTRLSELLALGVPHASAEDDAQLIARAMVLHRTRERAGQRKRIAAVGGAAALAAAFALLFLLGRHPGRATHTLASGDVIIAARNADFRVIEDREVARRIEVAHGAVLLDVRSRARGTFEVATPSARVRVVGTVFAVEVGRHGRTSVRVFEGRVDFVEAGGTRSLGAGEAVRSSDSESMDKLADEGAARAAARERRPTGASSPAPSVMSAPSSIEATHEEERHPSSHLVSVPGAAPRPAHEGDAIPTPNGSSDSQVGSRGAVAIRPDASELRQAIARGEALAVLGALPSARLTTRERAWLRADALRAVGRVADAANSYREIARTDDSDRQSAAYLSASLFLRANRASESLAVLDESGISRPGSPFAERALVVRARALAEQGSEAASQEAAREYLNRFPDGQAAESMRRIAGLN